MKQSPAPSPKKPVRPRPGKTVARSSSAGGGVMETIGTACKASLALALLGGGGWYAYRHYTTKAPVVEAEGKPAATPAEALPDPTAPARPVGETQPEPRPVEGTKPAEEKTPKLPALPALPPLDKKESVAALRDATLARMTDGRWDEHARVVRIAALAAVNERARTGGAAMLDGINERGALPLGLAQLDIISRTGAPALAKFAPAGDEFAARLLTSADLAECFLGSLSADDDAAEALRVWKVLDARESSPADKLHFRNLAVALALCHDKPRGEEHAAEVYAYYAEADRRKKLFVNIGKIRPDELAWGVGDHAFSLEDQRWALKALNFPAAKLGDAYPSIPYRINHPPYPEYTMETVRRMGGVCANQSQYAQGNARARGVPCAYVSGEGSRGAHAWFAFRTPAGWINTVGRYDDGYACGRATSPQTGKPVREWDLLLYNNRARSTGDFDAALRLERAARLLTFFEDTEGALNLLDAAVERDKGTPLFWRRRVEALLASDKPRPLEFWEKVVNDLHVAMKESPDQLDIADRVEAERVFPKMDPDRVAGILRIRRRQSIRENPARFDLLTESIRREAAFYLTRKDTARVGTLYNGSLREYGKNLPAFLRLADDFSTLSDDHPAVRKAGLATLESVFNKDVDTKLKGDTFALEMQAKVATKLSGIFAAEGDADKAGKYAARAKIIGEKSKAERAAMR